MHGRLLFLYFTLIYSDTVIALGVLWPLLIFSSILFQFPRISSIFLFFLIPLNHPRPHLTTCWLVFPFIVEFFEPLNCKSLFVLHDRVVFVKLVLVYWHSLTTLGILWLPLISPSILFHLPRISFIFFFFLISLNHSRLYPTTYSWVFYFIVEFLDPSNRESFVSRGSLWFVHPALIYWHSVTTLHVLWPLVISSSILFHFPRITIIFLFFLTPLNHSRPHLTIYSSVFPFIVEFLDPLNYKSLFVLHGSLLFVHPGLVY